MTPETPPSTPPEVPWTPSHSPSRNMLALPAYLLACLGPFALLVMATSYSPTNPKEMPELPVQIAWWALALSSPLGLVLGAIAYRNIRRSPTRILGRPFARAAMVVGSLASVSLLLTTPMLTGSRSSFYHDHNHNRCLSNVKQLGVAMMMYTQDYDDRYPPAASWNAATYPYMKNDTIYRCPDEDNDKLPSYAMNRALQGASLEKIEAPAQTVLLFDSIPGANRAGGQELLPDPSRHHEIQFIGFADGHAKAIQLREIGSLQWNLKLNTQTLPNKTESTPPVVPPTPSSSKTTGTGTQVKEKK